MAEKSMLLPFFKKSYYIWVVKTNMQNTWWWLSKTLNEV